ATPAEGLGAMPRQRTIGKEAYDPDKDDYDLLTAPIKPAPPSEAMDEILRKQIAALRSRILSGGNPSVVNHYIRVVRDLQHRLAVSAWGDRKQKQNLRISCERLPMLSAGSEGSSVSTPSTRPSTRCSEEASDGGDSTRSTVRIRPRALAFQPEKGQERRSTPWVNTQPIQTLRAGLAGPQARGSAVERSSRPDAHQRAVPVGPGHSVVRGPPGTRSSRLIAMSPSIAVFTSVI
ncbi:unnamed protein product, partial [Polarella glacialis]